jgi:hypothetical protein
MSVRKRDSKTRDGQRDNDQAPVPRPERRFNYKYSAAPNVKNFQTPKIQILQLATARQTPPRW